MYQMQKKSVDVIAVVFVTLLSKIGIDAD